MKLHLSMLKRVIDLPSEDPVEVRRALDDLGLEVKGIEGEGLSTIFTIESLANRGDHLYSIGAAREFSARYLSAIKAPQVSNDLPTKRPSVVARKLTAMCLRYSLLEMALPTNMKARSDVAQIFVPDPERHPIVDTLNYILLELGQPMHAFDRDKVEGEITIELSTAPETLEALDGNTYEVPANSILIKDKKKTIAVAGVIGCANSMVTPGTTRVLIESALFDPVTVRKTARAMGISTDASYAFERGCDWESAVTGLKRLLFLVDQPAGQPGQASAAHAVGFMSTESEPTPKLDIKVRISELKRHLNSPRVQEVELFSRLKNLGFQITPAVDQKDLVTVGVPSWRLWDIKNEADIVEEILRACSYSKVKLELPALDYEQAAETPIDMARQRIEPVLVGNGFLEVITKVFYSAKEAALVEKLNPSARGQHMTMKNSLESSYSHLKLTNLLHFAELVERNHRRGVQSIKVFECGRLFSGQKNADASYEHEREVLTLGVSGRWNDREWRQPEDRDVMMRNFKGVLESIIQSLGRECQVGESDQKLLHPGYQASLKAGRGIVGYFGLMHPALGGELDVGRDLFYAELDMEALASAYEAKTLQALIDFPVIQRDITLKLPAREQAAKVGRWVDELKLENLSNVAVIDDFKRKEEDFRRVTFRVTFQRADRTLEHAEVDRDMEKILASLKSEHGTVLA